MDLPRDDMQSLPENIEALRALVLTTMAERERRSPSAMQRSLERDTLQTQNDRLRHLLLKLTRMHFGPRSERLPEEQLQLGFEALEQAIAKADAEAEKRDPELRKDNAAKRRASRGALPAHLPRIEVTLAPEDTACPCCRASMTVIGEDTLGAAGRDPGAVSGDRDQASETRLPCLRRHRGAGAGAGAADRGRHTDRGDGRPCAGGALCRPSAAVSPGADPGAAGRHARAVHPVVLDGLRCGRNRPRGGAVA